MSSSRWIPLESNPEILNTWASKAGLAANDQFGDIYGLDDELLAMVPQPVKAVVLLFPFTDKFNAKRDAQNAKRGGDSIDPTVFWMKQTISNACGTMAILHALANTDVTLVPHSPLSRFIEESKDKPPLERAALLEHTPLFANIHAEMASSGQSAVPHNLDTDLHFTCFVRAPSADSRRAGVAGRDWRVIELDGTREGPVDHGPCTEEDFLKVVADIVKNDFISQSDGSLEFNLMSLGASP